MLHRCFSQSTQNTPQKMKGKPIKKTEEMRAKYRREDLELLSRLVIERFVNLP